MGAVSANLPTIQLNAGPKKVGIHKGQRLGSGTDLWKYWDELRMGKIDEKEWEEIGKALSCGFGACNTMGTASTMNGLMEALGMMPLGSSTLAVYGEERQKISMQAGRRIVEMVHEDLKPSDILTKEAFDNAIRLLLALGGSTNAVIHLTAIAGRLNIPIFPNRFDTLGREIPCIVNVQPSGEKLIDEFNEAGGIRGVLSTIQSFLNLNAKTITGKTLGEELAAKDVKIDEQIILPLHSPICKQPTLAVLTGNLAPDGAVIKVSAATPSLLEHTGKAVVFENYDEMLDNIDHPDLEVTKDSVLVLKNAGPKGVPGMPEWGMIPVPKKLQAQGVKDMIRISDSRMSGTSFGTVVLQVAPEAFVGGNINYVENGDLISLNIAQRSLQLLISDDELNQRKAAKPLQKSKHTRGYPSLYVREVLQANEGCDFDFLKPKNSDELKFIEPIVGRS
jgi:dihydroxy-acid dehydratase